MPRVAASQVIGIEAATAGDLVAYDSPGDVAWALKLAQRIRWHGDKNHFAWLDRQDSTGQWFIGQAEGCGVTIDKPLVLGPNDAVVKIPTGCDREKFLFFARAQVGRKYGFLTILSIFLTELMPMAVNVMLPDTWICSAVVGEALRFGGWYHDWPDIYQCAPDELWEALV